MGKQGSTPTRSQVQAYLKSKIIDGRSDISVFVSTGMTFCSHWAPQLRKDDPKTVDFTVNPLVEACIQCDSCLMLALHKCEECETT